MLSNNIILGPLLGLEGECNGSTYYSVCFLSEIDVSAPLLIYKIAGINNKTTFTLIDTLACGKFWRAEIVLPLIDVDQICDYQIAISKQFAGYASDQSKSTSSWSFFCPGASNKIQIAFASCNGFSSDKARAKHQAPEDFMWQRMQQQYKDHMTKNRYKQVVDAPYAALLMGGDQVYADTIFSETQPLYDWSKLPLAEQQSSLVPDNLKEKIDAFYLQIYLKGWTEHISMRYCLASIPTVMMWDDHDIIDGWGSQPFGLEKCLTYKAMFKSAKKYFSLFQLRGLTNRSLQQKKKMPTHFGMTLRFRDYTILAMDNRSQRTLHNIMGDGKQDFKKVLSVLQKQWKSGEKLLIMSAVPFLYRHFSEADTDLQLSIKFNAYDDIADHWRFKTHYDEMCSILNQLLEFQVALEHTTPVRIFIISGDVHVASSGAFREKFGKGAITQLISSGIMHPAPLDIEQSAIRITSSITQSDIELGGNIVLSATIRKDSAGNTILFHRNFACMHEGKDNKVWVNWHHETIDFPDLNNLTSRSPTIQKPKLSYRILSLPY